MTREFNDRDDAGQQLAERLGKFAWQDPVVIALPRGGVPVALPVAEALRAPLDLLMVQKLGTPDNPELAAGAVVNGDAPGTVFNADVLRAMRMKESDFDAASEKALAEITRRRREYLGSRGPVEVRGRDAIVVDDGIATGATVKAALMALGRRKPARLTLAVPVAASDTLDDLRPLVERLVCLSVPDPFIAVGAHYSIFRQVSDSEVKAALRRAEAWATD